MRQTRTSRQSPRCPRAVCAFAVIAAWLLTRGAPALASEVRVIAQRDSTLIESATGDVSNGSGFVIRCGRTGDAGGGVVLRAVLGFDVATALPPGSTVTSALLELRLTNSSTGSSTLSSDLTLHRMLAEWSEGSSIAFGGQGAPAQPGDATWIHRTFPNLSWTAAGGDFDPAALALESVGSDPVTYAWTSTALADCVQQWVDQPACQFGLMVRGDEVNLYSAKGFASREYPDEELLPRLVIEFHGPCPADITGNGSVDVGDLLTVITNWGPCASPPCAADIAPPDGDDQINVSDLLAVITAWGACP